MEIIGNATLYLGDCRDILPTLGDASVDSIVTDPPYHLTQVSRGGHARTNNPAMPHGRHRIGDKGFMGKVWDGGDIAHRVEMWAECLRVLKPGGHLLAFAGSRTYHRMTCAIEDAGFEIRDQIMWIYGSGFPKSRNLGGDWQGWGSALKPSHEPICMARKPLVGTISGNVDAHGTGAINIDACRVSYANDSNDPASNPLYRKLAGYANANASDDASSSFAMKDGSGLRNPNDLGRWPANVIHDGSPEVFEQFPYSTSGAFDGQRSTDKFRNAYGAFAGTPVEKGHSVSEGSAARFFYCAKASRDDRNEGLENPGQIHKHGVTLRQMENAVRDGIATGNTHPTVKPTDLMAYLCRLVTPPGGLVCDPFMGSGSTGKAAIREGFRFIGIDMTPEYIPIAKARIQFEIGCIEDAQRQESLFETAVPKAEQMGFLL